jgi:hypothetical protein
MYGMVHNTGANIEYFYIIDVIDRKSSIVLRNVNGHFAF